MSLPDLTGQNIENTYPRLVQTDGVNFYDGTGSVVNFGVNPFPYTGSAIITGSLEVIGPFTASGFNYPTIAGNEGEAIVIDQDGNLNFAYPKAITERVKNVSGGQLPKGTPVHATGSGTSGNIVGVIAADAGDPTKMPATYVLNETLDDESEGEALAVGYIQGVNTTGLIEGEVVYVAVGGGWTQTKPTGSALIQNLGIVTKVGSNGSGVVLGAGRSNDIPNIQSGYTWVGNSNGVPTAIPTSSLVVTNAISSSYTLTASYVQNAQTASHLNSLTQNVEILGNVTIHGTASVDILVTNYQSSSIIYSSGSTKFGDTLDDTHEFTGSIFTTGSISSTNTITATTGSFSYLQGNSPIVVGDPVTFQQAITASSISASIIYGDGSNLTGISSSSFSATSSFTPNAIVTASASPGDYTITLFKGDGSSFDVTLTAPAPIPPPVTDTGSFFTNATLSNDKIVFTKGDKSSLFLSLTSSYVLISQTSSFVQTSSFNNFTQSYYTDSASFDTRINNFSIDTSSLVTTSSFNTFTQSIQSSVDSLTNATSSYLLRSETSSLTQLSTFNNFTSSYNTGSFTGSFTGSLLGTSSWATNAISASYALDTTNASTASYVENAQTASYVLNAVSSSFALTASYALNAGGGVIINNNTDNYIVTATGTANTLNGEPGLAYDGSTLVVSGTLNANSITITQPASGIGNYSKNAELADSLWPDSATPALTSGSVVYWKYDITSGSIWQNATANTGSGIYKLGVVTKAESQDEIVLRGIVAVTTDIDALGGKPGDIVYLSPTSAGNVTVTIPTGSGEIIRILGYVYNPTARTIIFEPTSTWVEL